MFRSSLAEALRLEFGVLREIERANVTTTTESTILHALYRTVVAASRCASSEMAMQLLVESHRIHGDLEHYVAQSLLDPSNVPTFCVVVRPFVHFDVENEFRAFVFKRRLTAITQYNELCYFPRLLLCHDAVCRAMVDTTAALMPSLPPTLDNCVIDFVCIDEPTGWTARIVEINPMAEFAGSGLSSFEKDWRVLQGHDPFEFRFQKDAAHGKLALKHLQLFLLFIFALNSLGFLALPVGSFLVDYCLQYVFGIEPKFQSGLERCDLFLVVKAQHDVLITGANEKLRD